MSLIENICFREQIERQKILDASGVIIFTKLEEFSKDVADLVEDKIQGRGFANAVISSWVM